MASFRGAPLPPIWRLPLQESNVADRAHMTSHRAIVDGLVKASSSGESVVLATVVRATGSSYGGVGARMLVRGDGSTVGLVSGGCRESDLAAHARRVHEGG